MTETQKTAQVGVRENIRVRVHEAGRLRARWPGWDQNPTDVKYRLANRTDADWTGEHRNTTVIGLHEYIAANLDQSTSSNEDASHLAVGTATATPSPDNRDLGTEVYRTTITKSSSAGNTVLTSAFLDTSEANGNELTEVGLVTSAVGGSDVLLNHSLISTISKDDETTATIDVELTFTAES